MSTWPDFSERPKPAIRIEALALSGRCEVMSRSTESDRAEAEAALIAPADMTAPYAIRAAVGSGLPARVKEGPTTIEALADRCNAPIRCVRSPLSQFRLALSVLPQAESSGRVGYDTIAGRSFWQTLQRDSSLAASFDRYMAGWAAQRQALDTFARWGLADRSSVVVGSFFDALPVVGDVYILARAIHDWPDDDAVRILRRCSEAARPDSRVLLLGRLVDPEPSLQLLRSDLLMLVLFGSGESNPDLTRLFDASGLRSIEARATGHELALLKCSPSS